MHQSFRKLPSQTGFTIVELLIVIVIIGILAAITIVAYNGVQQRAQTAAVKSSLSDAATQLELAKVDTGIYPADTSGLKKDNDINYQYASSNDTYCLTATKGDTSYKIQSGNTTPTEGGCAGHGVGGVAALTNLVTNPSFETGLHSYGFNQSGYGSRAQAAAAAQAGAYGQRITATTSGTVSGLGPYIQVTNLSPEKSYTASVWIRASKSMTYSISIERRNAAGTNIGTISAPRNLSPNTWTRMSIDIPPTPNMERFTFCVYSSSASIVSGDTIDFDGLMVTEGSQLHTYSDGDSTNWIWNGSAHNATSTGPAS